VVLGTRPAASFASPRSPDWLRRMRHLLTGSAVFFLLPATALAQQAPDLPLPRTTIGTVGLLEMPSARMAEDGQLSAGASYMKNTQHYNLGFQIMPWLEGSFRYSGITHFIPDFPVYWDRSFGMKMRLFEEGDVRPALAIGINDLIGTGIYSGEYLVASKQFGDFDTSLGIGWGRLGSANTIRNPFALIAHSFEVQRPGVSVPGGTPFNSFFHGPTAGVFGGVVWRTPLEGLSLIAEFSSDAYKFEDQQHAFHPLNQLNYGLSYELNSGTLLNVSYLYNASVSGGITFQLDPTRSQFSGRLGAPVPSLVVRTPEAQRDALRTLVEQRDPAYATGRVRAATRNSFVDELLKNSAFSDVLITGRTMTVTLVDGAATQPQCRIAAAIASGSGTGITEVMLRTSRSKTVAHCNVPRRVQASLQSATYSSVMPTLELHQLPLLIDATDVQPPVDRVAAERNFRAEARKQNIFIQAVAFTETEATVYFTNTHYRQQSDAIERLVRMLMGDAPTSIEKIRLVFVQDGIAQQEYHILRTPAERAMTNEAENGSVFNSPVTISSAPLENPILSAQTRKFYPHFDWDIFPQFRQQFFDPSNPVGVQVVGALQASVALSPGLTIWGEAEGSLFDTFNTARASDSLLPHVRTDFVNYFTKGKNGIGALQADYRTKLTPQFYATVRAGYLESMFAGVGGEVLYRPDGARWAIGADVYEVWQRNFDRLFGLQNYRATTGHVSLYWASPFYDLDFQLRAGQYLAQDRGLTLQITRRFSTGVEIGAFATKTNVSASRFGEGSFDKGIIIRIPLDWMAPINTQSQLAIDLRPVQRDGGQTLQSDATLYEETRLSSQSELARSGASMADGW
jgi:hypothetical protein